MRDSFERGLQELRDEILVMGSMVDKALYQAVESLRQRQRVLSQYVIQNDHNINRKRFDIEEKGLTLIATQAPVAQDLRLIAAILNISNELERMGDHAKGIARINEMMKDEPLIKPLIDIPKMASKCSQMLNAALDAFIKLDAAAARQVANEDDELDVLYDNIYHDLLNIMTEDSTTVNRATYLLWVSHNLERFGDRIVNICERVIFVATGELVEISNHRNG